MTFGGFPRRAAMVTATAVSHRVVGVNWTTPSKSVDYSYFHVLFFSKKY